MVTNRLPPRHGELIGRRVGGYLIDSLLGEGGMGSVYSATNHRLGRKAAIKVIAREYTQNAEVVGRFFREAQAVAALDDPNIIDIYDSHEFSEDGLTYIAMKFIEGHSLAALSELMGPMPIDVAGAISLQIASGLDAAHELGIIHRDIKPHNILISRRWRRRFFVTIVDFGIAKLLDPHLVSSYQTRTSLVVGTIPYMAPEQARGDRDVDARADIYSLGVVLYELLTGRKPYNEETVYGLVEKQARGVPFPRPRELRADIPSVIDETLLAALQIDRARRLSSMKEFAQRIARGLTNGDRLLTTLAARLCVAGPSPPNELTLTGDVEGLLTRWTPAQTMNERQRRSIVPLVAAMLIGTAIGGGVVKLATLDPSHATSTAMAPGIVVDNAGTHEPVVSGTEDPRRMERIPPAPITKPEPMTKSEPAAKVEPPPVAKAVQRSAVEQRPAVSVEQNPITKMEQRPATKVEQRPVGDLERKPAANAEPSPAAKPEQKQVAGPEQRPVPNITEPAEAPEDGAISGTGVLVVRTRTWADVWIDGRLSGPTPLRVDVLAGSHTVLLIGDSHRETVTVSIKAKAETVIDKNW